MYESNFLCERIYFFLSIVQKSCNSLIYRYVQTKEARRVQRIVEKENVLVQKGRKNDQSTLPIVLFEDDGLNTFHSKIVTDRGPLTIIKTIIDGEKEK